MLIKKRPSLTIKWNFVVLIVILLLSVAGNTQEVTEEDPIILWDEFESGDIPGRFSGIPVLPEFLISEPGIHKIRASSQFAADRNFSEQDFDFFQFSINPNTFISLESVKYVVTGLSFSTNTDSNRVPGAHFEISEIPPLSRLNILVRENQKIFGTPSEPIFLDHLVFDPEIPRYLINTSAIILPDDPTIPGEVGRTDLTINYEVDIEIVDTSSVVYFVNGVKTDWREVNTNYEALREALKRSNTPALANLEVRFVYNPTVGIFTDFAETAEQKIAEKGIDVDNLLVTPVRAFDAGLKTIGEIALGYLSLQPEEIKDAVIESIADIVLAEPRASVVGRHVATFKKDVLDKGKRLILVPHSQGNLFANEAYDELFLLDEHERTRVVSVATPTRILSSGVYTTDKDDLVIFPLAVVGTARAANVENNFGLFGLFATDFLGHSFSNIYMNDGANTEAQILGHISQAVLELSEL